ncbi:class II fumarate hydratase [Caldinitratiruptor microaerophilus]|uniref:Fumarate hydratase class II n=1 Tax=Caldinitratiruptor microaerophilus TaxID=671077 RepID=A0AA35CIV9_9FIRM|nr:class II fumarate hydratase [Caldinitratiruptor microaerophilus]BDG59173.1 class II fumarate hydratase [Caldinitratiruptor microaerophilus]
MPDYRIERDSMGEMRVPAGALYGAQTARALENFPISGITFPRRFYRAMGLIKKAAALTNRDLGLLDPRIADAIARAAGEVADGRLDEHLVVDIFQTGSGTSTNMNVNEVIANRATEILGGERGSKLVHPNDHVNLGQSSNDVIPTAIRIAALEAIEEELAPALERLGTALQEKARAWDGIVKIGRTHLMDATPIRLGQEFSGYASQVDHALRRLRMARAHLVELPLGGTAVGTGINTHPEFARRAIALLAEWTGLPFREAENHFEAQGSQDALVEASALVRTVAVGILKIANDIRWLASGPRTGIGELVLPPVQPGSSIMPGKVNPVIAESLMMVCVQVMGNDLTVSLGGQHGNFELNVMMPVMAHNLLQSITLLARAVDNFTRRAVAGLEANRQRCEEMVERSLAMVTSLAPVIGYDRAAALAKKAHEENRTIRELLLAEKVLPADEIARLLDPWSMTEPGLGKGEGGG